MKRLLLALALLTVPASVWAQTPPFPSSNVNPPIFIMPASAVKIGRAHV